MDPFIPAYCAGLFDVKGNIHVNKENKSFSLQIQIVSTDRSMLEWFQQQCGGKVYAQSIPKKAGWVRCYALVWTSKATQRELLITLKPYMIVKRQAAEIALALLDTPAVEDRRALVAQFAALAAA